MIVLLDSSAATASTQQLPPDAVDDTATATIDTPLTINVLANDVDPDGDQLYISDATDPANGSVSINDQRDAIIYTPDPGFVGIDRFQYTAMDGHPLDPDAFAFETDTAVVRIEVVATPDILPVINLPPNLPVTSEATGPLGADSVLFAVTATGAQGEAIAPSCNPSPGSSFPVGNTEVTCTATDTRGLSSTATFTVVVQDTTEPVLNLPGEITAETSSSETPVSYSVSATDIVDGSVAPVCAPASGSIFNLGDNVVSCEATDSAGNTAIGSFVVRVLQTEIELTIVNTDVRRGQDAYSVDISGTISDGSPGTTIQIDWDDGTTSIADVEGESWSAEHEYDLVHGGTEKTVTSSLIIAGSPTAISDDRSILITAPPADSILGLSTSTIIIMAIAAGAAGGGAILLTKSGILQERARHLKRNKLPREKESDKKDSRHSVQLDFRYGIENLKEIDASIQETQAKAADIKEGIIPELEQAFKSTLGASLQNIKKVVNEAKDTKELADFCKDIAKDPDEFLRQVSDRGLAKMIDAAAPFLSSMLINQLSVKSHIQTRHSSKALFDIDLEMQPIRPFIEVVLLVNNTPTKSFSMVFQFDSSASISKAGLVLKENGKREWKLENIIANVSLSLVKLSARLHGVSSSDYGLKKQIALKEREFRLREVTVEE